LYSKSSICTITGGGLLVFANQTVFEPPVRSALKVWEKQYEVFGDRMFTGAEWKNGKKQRLGLTAGRRRT
jgi:hypothetical protein